MEIEALSSAVSVICGIMLLGWASLATVALFGLWR